MPRKATSKAPSAALRKFNEQFDKAFGAGQLVSADTLAPYEVISTGSLVLDYALGVGGWVEGRLAEVWGQDAIGKSSLCLCSAVEAQEKHPDKLVGFIDMEQTVDRGLAQGLGVDLERMRVYSPTSAEDVADAMKMMLQSDLFSLVILDSIGGMIPEKEKEKDADEAVVAAQAKIVTRMVKIAAVEAHRSGTVVLLINQVRANVGGYGAATMTGGGFALRHVTTHKVHLKRTATTPYTVTRDGEKHTVGHELAAVVERNKVAPPRRTATINLFNQPSKEFGPQGIDKADEAATLGLQLGLVDRSGAWYTVTMTGERCQGRDGLVKALRSQPEVVEDIRTRALASLSREVVIDADAEPLADLDDDEEISDAE